MKKQNHHFVVPDYNFRLVKGADKITTYTFNKHQARHTFCSVCGVQSFYTPRTNPDGKGDQRTIPYLQNKKENCLH